MMIFQLPKKHTGAETTIFTQMSAIATKHQAINLSQGFPDFDLDASLGAFLSEGSSNGFNQYAPMAGLPILRDAIASDFLLRYNEVLNPELEITITPGASYAIYTALSTILSKGDEVIILEPAYDCYLPSIEMNGAIAVAVKLDTETFAPDWQKVKDAITPKTKAIVVNTPHNPTGTIWSKSDWNNLAEVLRDTNIFVISDEVYEQLVYDGSVHFSALQHPELRARSFVVYSFGKAYHNTGWKVGYCIAAVHLTKAFRQIHQFVAFSVNTPAQYALAKYLLLYDKKPACDLLEAQRNYFIEAMKQTSFRLLEPSKGSYFQLASYAHLSDMKDKDFAIMLTEQYGVATIPVSAFYVDNYDGKLLRFCFAKKVETLNAAVQRLSEMKL